MNIKMQEDTGLHCFVKKRVQANNSVMCGYFCIWFIGFILAGKKLNDFTILFSPYEFDKNDNIILRYFKDEWNW